MGGSARDRRGPSTGVTVRAGRAIGTRVAPVTGGAGVGRSAGLLEALEDVGIGARQVECAGPSVFVVQQRVPPAEIGQRVDPLALRGGDQLETAGVIDLAGF